MKYITTGDFVPLIDVRIHLLVVFSSLLLVLVGQVQAGVECKVICPLQVVPLATARGWTGCGGSEGLCFHDWPGGCERWHVVLVQSAALWVLWQLSGCGGPGWVSL